jgi:hypothetical protein
VLTLSLDKENNVPLGTFITWFGLICLPLSIYWSILEFRKPSVKLSKSLSIVLKIVIVLALLWIPISYLLAGNISFTFTERTTFQGGQQAMKWFWRLTYGIPTMALLTLIFYWLFLWFKKN